ncbi:MAG: DUF2461 domain-containing protein [Planctomycetes bacterium]|nr:DUF2461 domain-containing protein [Planctomycetota bacterium]
MGAKKKAAKKSAKKATARSGGSPFGPGLVTFLTELRANNKRSWFQDNAERYESDVREPAFAFIREFRGPLAKVSKHFVAEDKKVGGALMRIHRDVRFSKDKSPYKTNLGIQFRHEGGSDVHAPGIYLHVDPDVAFLGVGMWHPPSEALEAVRQAIVASPREWTKAVAQGAFAKSWTLEGDSLKRPPKGFDPEHPLVEDLKRKDHIAVVRFAPSRVTKKDFVPWMAERVMETKPFLKFLTKATGEAF